MFFDRTMVHLVKVLLSSTQKNLSEWNQKIRAATEIKEQARVNYQAKKDELLPQLIEAHKKGVSTRELEQITGINHTTIARWIREGSGQKEKKNAST